MKQQRKRVYIQGRGFADISKTILLKLFDIGREPATSLLKSALKSGSEVAGDKIEAYVANKITDKVTTPSKVNISAIEDLENKIKQDINNYAGKGFKKVIVK